MIVCQCHAVSDREISEVAAGEAASLESVGEACGAGTDCEGCHGRINALLEAAGDESPVLISG